jgi:hypothetical protein
MIIAKEPNLAYGLRDVGFREIRVVGPWFDNRIARHWIMASRPFNGSAALAGDGTPA